MTVFPVPAVTQALNNSGGIPPGFPNYGIASLAAVLPAATPVGTEILTVN